ncbi:MAG TPA: MscL family protein [Aeromicrobium sp.]|jgi:large conductance mechanosensitive channel|nr:MscL family protein [Aeromicrobium sp.]HKY58243.1 MscL family protein [Aeromicrobium sp.]
MSGFKNFVLRGNLVDVAVAFIIGAAFASVVTTFVAWLTAQLPSAASKVFSNEPNSLGAFLNALIAFLLLAAVVYFCVVLPYTRAKERFFPGEAAGPSEVELLTEIRDALQNR